MATTTRQARPDQAPDTRPIITLRPQEALTSYDQRPRAIYLDHETEAYWVGPTITNMHRALIHWPKSAWRVVPTENTTAEDGAHPVESAHAS